MQPLGWREVVSDDVDVSILIRPEGRMQPPACRPTGIRRSDQRFNPHPARRPDATAGAADKRHTLRLSYSGFNPHPARRPDATPDVAPTTSRTGTSLTFQSSSGQKAGCNGRHSPGLALGHHHGVSILIRPEGRMQPPQSSWAYERTRRSEVSILIRPEGRMQPDTKARPTLQHQGSTCFNPHPARRPDATLTLADWTQ